MSGEKEERRPPAWKHDVTLGLDPIKQGVIKAREATVRAMEETRKLLERHKAALGRLQRR